jgi:hypothetical protein
MEKDEKKPKKKGGWRDGQENKIKGNKPIGCRHLNETRSKIVNKEENKAYKIFFSSMWKNE